MSEFTKHARKWQMHWRITRARVLGEAEGYRMILRYDPHHQIARLLLRVCLDAAAARRRHEKEHEKYAASHEALDRAA